MSANTTRFIKNLFNPDLVAPLRYPGLFQAGATQEVTAGQLLERTADTNTRWVPINSDHDATVTKLAIAGQDITSGDLAGYYELIVPRPGDVFEFDLAAAGVQLPEDALYYSSPTAFALSGSNILAYSVIQPNHPGLQKRLSQGQLGDQGETFRSTNRVWAVFREAVSLYSLLQQA